MSQGQITMDTGLGRRLHELAKECRTIVEIGTWNGLGSTKCLFDGMVSGQMYSYEANLPLWEEACRNWPESKRIIRGNGNCGHQACTHKSLRLAFGSLATSIQPFTHPNPDQEQFRQYWMADKTDLEAASFLPVADYTADRKIDLLLLDGGEWTTEIEFDLLYERCHRWIALDDTNPEQSNKNHRNRRLLIEQGWTVLDDHLHDRHGWFIAQKP